MPKSAERCEEIRQQMREHILQESVLYFAKNGFAGTKISDLAKYIGIGQGTMYQYFTSKEELFQEIHRLATMDTEIRQLKTLSSLPISAKQKLNILSDHLLKRLCADANFAGMVALNTQMLLEAGAKSSCVDTTYHSELYKYTEKIILQGQKENSIVSGSSLKLADYYWGVVYLYALKRLFTADYEMITVQDLNRTLLIGE